MKYSWVFLLFFLLSPGCDKDEPAIKVDLTSAGGYLYPLGHFIDHGITQREMKT
ncbi:hypothetical protein [Desulfobacula sp.]